MKPYAEIGGSLSQIDTPALIIDLDAFETNLKTMADQISGGPAKLRGHSKTHKSPIIGLKQMELGAIGVCCQKVAEAEVMVEEGVDNVLISNQIAGSSKLDRLADLNKRAYVPFCVDHLEGIAQASMAAKRAGITMDVLVEIDVGGERCGVLPGQQAVDMAKLVEDANGLRFAGLQAYHGSIQHIRDHLERHRAAEAAIILTRETVAALSAEGYSCDIVGGAGTGTFQTEAVSGVYNELQAGSYVFMDADYSQNKDATGQEDRSFQNALFVLTTVMSNPVPERVILDAGHKTCAIDSGPPQVYGLPGAITGSLSDEHTVLTLKNVKNRPKWGENVLLIPGHCDPTVNLHSHYICVRSLHTPEARVEDIWPVAARGALN